EAESGSVEEARAQEESVEALPAAAKGIAVASRELPGAVEHDLPIERRGLNRRRGHEEAGGPRYARGSRASTRRRLLDWHEGRRVAAVRPEVLVGTLVEIAADDELDAGVGASPRRDPPAHEGRLLAPSLLGRLGPLGLGLPVACEKHEPPAAGVEVQLEDVAADASRGRRDGVAGGGEYGQT